MTTDDTITHYSPPHKLAGDAVIACGNEHWSTVASDPALVTCKPCREPAAQRIAQARAARAKTSVNNPLNEHIDYLIGLIEGRATADQDTRLRLAGGVLGYPVVTNPAQIPSWEAITAEVRSRLELTTVNGYALSRIVFDLYDAGALHARCTACGTEQAFDGSEEGLGGLRGAAVALDRVTEWAAGHVKDCRG